MDGECLTEVRGTSDLLLFSSFSILGKFANSCVVSFGNNSEREVVVLRFYAPGLCTGSMAAPSAGSLDFFNEASWNQSGYYCECRAVRFNGRCSDW